MIVEHTYIKKTLIFIGILGFLVVGTYIYFFYDIRSQTRDSLELLQTLERDVARRDKFEDIEKTLKTLSSRVESLDSFVITEDGIVRFLEIIEDLGDEQDVEITKRIERLVAGDRTGIRVRLSIEGSWQGLQNLLALIENLPFSITVDSFNARVSAEGVWSGNIDFNVASNS